MQFLSRLSVAALGGVLFFGSLVHADPAVEAWIRTYPWPPYTYGAMVAVDTQDNVVSVGFDPGASDLVTVKYDALGNLLWERHYTMDGYALWATWVATDADDNVIVTGYPQTFSSNPVPVGLLTLKYNSDGTFLWDDLFSATWGVTTRAILDDAGNIFVTGRGWFGTYDFATIKYAPDGTRIWQDVFDQGGGFHTPTAMDLDADGNLLVAGGGLSGGMITALYNANGVRQWVVERPGTAGRSVRWTNDGHFYLTGSWYTQTTSNDVRLLKYDTSGSLTWERFYDFGGTEYGTKLELDSQGNVFVTGYQDIYADWLTLKTDSDGNLLWSRVQDSHPSNDEFPNFLVTGPEGEVYITGTGGPPPPGPNSSYLSMVTLRYDADGTTAWTGTHYVWASRGVGAALASDNSLVVVGLGNSITTIKYAQAAVGTPEIGAGLAGTLMLEPARPNPFGSDTELSFRIPEAGTTSDTQLRVFDAGGRLVRDLLDASKGPGMHTVRWDGRDGSGRFAAAGIYFVRLQGGGESRTSRLVLMR